MTLSCWRLAVAFVAILSASCTSTPPESTSPPPAEAPPAAAAVAPPPEVVPAEAAQPAAVTKPAASGGHHHAAPHGGTLVEFGEEFAHLELVLDAKTGTLTAYTLDGEAERAVRVNQPAINMAVTLPDILAPIAVDLQPVENSLTGEKAGDTSQFRAVVPQLIGRSAFKGTVGALTIRGQAFTRVHFDVPGSGH